MTRVVLCANNVDEVGGAQRVVHVLARGFHDRGHDVSVIGITPFEPKHDFSRGAGLPYESRALMSRAWPKKAPHSERERSTLRQEAVAEMGHLLRSAGDEGSVIITAQVWAMEILADAMASASPDIRERWTVIGQYHGAYAAAASGRDLGRILRSYAPVPVFTALTEEDAVAFTAAGLNNVVTMPNPLAFWPDNVHEDSHENSHENSEDHGQESSLLYLGRLSEEKGVDLLIDAWSLIADSYPNWRLRIVGDGPDRDALHAQASDLAGSDRIEWRPTSLEPESEIRESDLVVLPSRTEGLPLVLAEAQASGVPVVATDCSSGVRELVGDWGRLVARGNSRALARALDAAMSDGAWRRVASERGREEMKRFRLEAIMTRWESLFDRVLR